MSKHDALSYSHTGKNGVALGKGKSPAPASHQPSNKAVPSSQKARPTLG